MMMTGVVRIGNEPVMRTTPNGDQVLELSLAYNYGRKSEDGKKPSQWIQASFWGTRAEKLQPYLKKGDQIFVSLTDVHVSIYEKKDGSGTGASIRAKIGEVELIAGGRTEGQAKPEAKASAKPKADAGSFNDLDDDIPF
jgi:single-strand DNA-binding protein